MLMTVFKENSRKECETFVEMLVAIFRVGKPWTYEGGDGKKSQQTAKLFTLETFVVYSILDVTELSTGSSWTLYRGISL